MRALIIITVVLFLLPVQSSHSQCNVTVNSGIPATITCGESIEMIAAGTGSGPGTFVDFNNSSTEIGWTNTSNIDYTNICGPTLDGTPGAWFGNSTFPRILTTTGYDMSCGGDVCFDIDFGMDDPCGGCQDCDDPDQPNEGVFFQYSVDGGTNWVDIFYFQPDNANSAPFYDWTNYCFTIPAAAWSTNTMFQWHQPTPTSELYDHWGLDNISIVPASCGTGYYYEWDGVLGDSDTTVSLTSSQTFNVLFTNGINDSCSTTYDVTVEPFNVILNTTVTDVDCGECINVFGQLSPQPLILGGSFGIQWDPDSVMTSPNSMFTDVCPESDLMIFATIFESNSGCSGTDSVSLTLNLPDPGFNFSQLVFCNDDGALSPTITGDPGGTFSAPAGLSIDNLTGEIDPSLSTPGVYSITYTPVVNCDVDSTLTVTIYGLPNVDAGADISLCPGDQATLIGNGALSYVWDNGVIDGINFTPASTQAYEVTGTDINGCQNTDQVTVTLIPPDDPIFDYSGDVDFCIEGNNISAVISGTTGGTFSYVALDGGTLSLNTSTGDIDLNSSTVGQYEVHYNTTSNGTCPDSSFIVIQIHPSPYAGFVADTTFGCEPLIVSFTPNSNQPGQTCEWDFDNGQTSSDCGTVQTTYMAGIYDITLTVTSEVGCVTSFTADDLIDVTAIPDANFLASPFNTTIEFTEIEFTNYSSFASTYIWNFGLDSTTSTEENPIINYPEIPEIYTVTLTAFSDDGLCWDATTAEIIINDILTFYIPNVFTPNGDSMNELFTPVFTSGFDEEGFSFKIFNRWGELLFESESPYQGWDGTYQDGVRVPDGVYVWKVTFGADNSEFVYRYFGHVTVLK